MINGHMTHAGDLEIDGEKLTGIFILCTVDELRKVGGMLAETAICTITLDSFEAVTIIKQENAKPILRCTCGSKKVPRIVAPIKAIVCVDCGLRK